MRVLVAGARGFIGKALCPVLREAGHDVVEGVRPEFDVEDPERVRAALQDVDAAVWLVHGLRIGRHYGPWERIVAMRFGEAARDAGLRKIVYLGGVVAKNGTSRHLDSRHLTARALGHGGVDVVQIRAGMVIGAGSESWLLVRDGAARLPLFLAPPWLSAKQRPVALADIVAALARALDDDIPAGDYEAPGPELLTGREIVERTARLLGRRPRILGVPGFPRRVAAALAPFVTRADADVARELLRGAGLDLAGDVGDNDADARCIFARMPEHRRLTFAEAAERAIADDDVNGSARLVERVVRAVTS